MIYVYLFMSLFLCLPLLHSATKNDTIPVCPESFSCPDLAPFKYPYFNASDKGCGLIKVHCTSKVKEIQLGNRSYEIIARPAPGSSVWVHNRTHEKLVKAKSCEALMDNFISPTPLLFSILLSVPMSLYKCTKKANGAAQLDAYFDQHNYNSYNSCKDHNFYFKYSFNYTATPSDLPQRCEVIHLPVIIEQTEIPKLNHTDLFSLLSFEFSISFPLTPSCSACNNTGGQCDSANGQFQCLLPNKDKHVLKLSVVLAVTGSAIFLMLSSVLFIIWRCCWTHPFLYVSSKNKSKELEDGSLFCGVSVYSYTELQDATKNFDPSRELGDGGYGAVYHGKLQDGREVAVKRLYEHNYKRVQQFMNEVEILTRLRHPNLVVLYGCTSRQSHELLLVYEYIPNGTVADHLHGDRANPSLLTWPLRMKITRETASALAYLHASEIIHRDVKTNNILLDHNFCVKLADFGLSRLLPNEVTYVSTAPQGTPGYVDPQYHQRFQLTDKSDVYSFGVVLVELISAMVAVDLSRSGDEISLANLAINRIQRHEIDQLIDPALGSNLNAEIMRMITSVAELAFLCLQFDSEMRPTMNEVLDMLDDIQGDGRIDADGSINESTHVDRPPLSETNDTIVLLRGHAPSPVTVMGKWHSDSSESSRVSMSGDRLAMKNHISI